MRNPKCSHLKRVLGINCLLLSFWLGLAGFSHAQILVIGNLANRTSDTNASQIGSGSTNGKLIGFTMGSTSMSLQDLQLQFAIPGGIASAIVPVVTIWQGTSSSSLSIIGSTPLVTLTNPPASNSGSTTSSLSLTYTFSVSTPFTLQAGASYDIVAQESSGTGSFVWELGSPQTGSGAPGVTQFSGGLFGAGSPTTYGSSSGNVNWYQVDAVAVPEPSTWAFLAFGLILLPFLRFRFQTRV